MVGINSMKEFDAEKETYRLWWQYIIANDNYKELLKGKFKMERYNIHHYFTNCITKKTKHGLEISYDKLPKAAKTTTFDKWWKYRKRYLERENSGAGIKEVDTEFLKLLSRLSNGFTNENYKGIGTILICISPHGKTVENLQKELKELLRKRRETSLRDYDFEKDSFEIRRAYKKPTKILSHNEIVALKEYLSIYKLREEKFKWEEIYKKIDGRLDNSKKGNLKENTIREFKRVRKYCETIFKNVENGMFPGHYK